MKHILKFIFMILGFSSILFWLLMLFYVVDFDVSIKNMSLKNDFFPIVDKLTTLEGKLEKLSNVGGFFNILTSLTSVFIVWLVATGVYYQKKELDELKKQINEQMENDKEEEKINRTINEFENWLALKRKVENNISDRKNIHSICSKIEWIISIQEHEFKRFFKFDLLMKILTEQSTQGLIVDMEDSLADEIQASLNDINLRQDLEDYYEAKAMGADFYPSKDVKRLVETEALDKRIIQIKSFINA